MVDLAVLLVLDLFLILMSILAVVLPFIGIISVLFGAVVILPNIGSISDPLLLPLSVFSFLLSIVLFMVGLRLGRES